jgi:alcohol dehydrogenase
MFTVDSFIPVRIIFGAGRLTELAHMPLPGKKALVCLTHGRSLKKLGIEDRVIGLLHTNHVETVLYDQITANPTQKSVMIGARIAREAACDFVIGLGGGSSIDAAKAIAVMAINPGNLWDYAYTGTGGRQVIANALPVVAISTTCGTGTETDPYFVVTNEETGEKLDFVVDAAFPAVALIDPDLMCSLPRDLTIYQGFDALFHAAECYVSNGHANRLLDLYATDAVRTVSAYLPTVVRKPDHREARTQLAYAANILGGFTQSLVSTTSHHILGQTLGGFYPDFPHGATLITVAIAYYSQICGYLPEEFDELGLIMGRNPDANKPGFAFVQALIDLMEKTGCENLKLSDFGVIKEDFSHIANRIIDEIGVEMDRYPLTKDDVIKILHTSL